MSGKEPRSNTTEPTTEDLIKSVAALAEHREVFADSEAGFAAWLLICDLAETITNG